MLQRRKLSSDFEVAAETLAVCKITGHAASPVGRVFPVLSLESKVIFSLLNWEMSPILKKKVID